MKRHYNDFKHEVIESRETEARRYFETVDVSDLTVPEAPHSYEGTQLYSRKVMIDDDVPDDDPFQFRDQGFIEFHDTASNR